MSTISEEILDFWFGNSLFVGLGAFLIGTRFSGAALRAKSWTTFNPVARHLAAQMRERTRRLEVKR